MIAYCVHVCLRACMSQLINLLRGGRRVLYQHAGTPNIAKVGSILYTTVPT